jgi:hypothetical protein
MNKPFGFIFWVHIIISLLFASTPFWLDWKLVIVGFVLLHIQWFILGGCFLTFLETGRDRSMSFEYYYLSKIWPGLNKKILKNISLYVTPTVILALALLLQIYLGLNPLVKI